ncbi:MAG: hypothetical protein JO319_06555 [Acidobacteriaceae bacterium]|nr:hypothetical protein [Acidobacteriaceae bacterium]
MSSDAGYEALRLSIRSAWNLFGGCARYTVCVNTIPLKSAKEWAQELPCDVNWIEVRRVIPAWLRAHLSPEMAEGVAWKLLPVRLFPDLHELSLDNDVILWAIPGAMREWLLSDDPDACLMAGDVQPALGQFGATCNYRSLNSGIRGLPPGFEMEERLQGMLLETGITLQSELDEQGLQAAVLLQTRLYVVSTEDVSICSPFPNHQHTLGTCGAHFVGLNPKRLPWKLNGRGAHELIRARWQQYAPELARLSHSGPVAIF